jgi:hypothetical protein
MESSFAQRVYCIFLHFPVVQLQSLPTRKPEPEDARLAKHTNSTVAMGG